MHFLIYFFIFIATIKNLYSVHKNDSDNIFFLYPIGTIFDEESEKIIVMYQNDYQKLSVFLWDPITKKAYKALSQCYNPAGIIPLPDQKSFSFIENDCLRIKKISKRSPSTIHLYGPYDITIIHWIDTTTCYFEALEMNNHALFYATTDSQLSRITPLHSSCDYLYPAKIDSQMFCILRNRNPQKELLYSFVSFYCDTNKESTNDQNELFLFENTITPITLSMESAERGYVLYYRQQNVLFSEDIITFTYSMLKKQEQKWYLCDLFNFQLPISLVTHQKESRSFGSLYESIFPFLPKKIGNFIYFSSLSNINTHVDLYAYDCLNVRITQCVAFKYDLIFSPCTTLNNIIYCGYSSKEELINFFDEKDEEADCFFELPSYQIQNFT